MYKSRSPALIAVTFLTVILISMDIILCMHEQFCPFYKKIDPPPVFFAKPDGTCAPELQNCDRDSIYYSDDGSCNNLRFSYFGQAMYPFERILPANYSDGFYQPRVSVDGTPLPLPRVIRTTILPNADYRARDINVLFYAFGQYNSHDGSQQVPIISDAQCCVNGRPARPMPYVCLPTIIPPNDEFYSEFGVTCVDSKRSTNTHYLGCNIRPIRQINFQTAPLDLSILYGPSTERNRQIRAFRGGLLRAEEDTDNGFQGFPFITSGSERCPLGGLDSGEGNPCFFSGDNRINQNPEIFLINTLFFRLHAYIAKHLQKLNPHWQDEKLYREARRICVAMYQHLVGAEFLPILLGPETASLYRLYPATQGYVSGYDPTINVQTFHSYSATVGRSGHSTVIGFLRYGNSESYRLREKYFNLDFLLGRNAFLNLIEGYAFQQCQRQDKFFTEDINNYLFPVPDLSYGNDLSTVDIMRTREFGVQPYNRYREICGLCKLNTFEELTDEIMDPADVQKLRSLYKYVDDIDLYVGGLLEKPMKGSTVGPTFSCILGAQFHQWKYGDRLYHEFPTAKFTHSQLKTIRETTFSQVLCIANPRLRRVPRNGFLAVSQRNPIISCEDIPRIDLTQWSE